MPVIIVYGIPEEVDGGKIGSLYEDLLSAAAEIEELRLTKADISCFFPSDRMKRGLGNEIIIFVKGLFDYPKRTQEVRSRLAESLTAVAKRHFPIDAKIECFIEPFKFPENGFAIRSRH